MIYGSVCSGIEAATVAWHPIGWKPAWFSEIEKFPSALLQHHYPERPNLGDMTKLHDNATFQHSRIDLLVGGTPCQSFSVAGLRKGLDDPRGNLALEFLRLVDVKLPQWFLWENVPGVLSSGQGRDFGSFLGAIQKLGYGFAYRILDAQYFGVPQRRRRVFVVGYLGDWRPAATVLFERESLSGNPAPSRKKRKGASSETERSTVGCLQARDYKSVGNQFVNDGKVFPVQTFDRQSSGEYGCATVASTVASRDYKSASDLITFNRQENKNFKMSDSTTNPLRRGQTEAILAIRNSGRDCDTRPNRVGTTTQENIMFSLQATQQHAVCSHFVPSSFGNFAEGRETLRANNIESTGLAVHSDMQVRRLTPRECERLQGFPDDYTLVPSTKKAADSPRYKALGNSMAVPCMRWLGERIELVHNLNNF